MTLIEDVLRSKPQPIYGSLGTHRIVTQAELKELIHFRFGLGWTDWRGSLLIQIRAAAKFHARRWIARQIDPSLYDSVQLQEHIANLCERRYLGKHAQKLDINPPF